MKTYILEYDRGNTNIDEHSTNTVKFELFPNEMNITDISMS